METELPACLLALRWLYSSPSGAFPGNLRMRLHATVAVACVDDTDRTKDSRLRTRDSGPRTKGKEGKERKTKGYSWVCPWFSSSDSDLVVLF